MSKLKNILSSLNLFRDPEKTSNILLNDNDIIMVSFVLDCKTQDVISLIDAHPHPEDSEKMIKQAESLAVLLNKICGTNSYLTDTVIKNIEILKSKSNKNLLFFSNVLFFWKHFLTDRIDRDKNDSNIPIIKPTQVFKN